MVAAPCNYVTIRRLKKIEVKRQGEALLQNIDNIESLDILEADEDLLSQTSERQHLHLIQVFLQKSRSLKRLCLHNFHGTEVATFILEAIGKSSSMEEVVLSHLSSLHLNVLLNLLRSNQRLKKVSLWSTNFIVKDFIIESNKGSETTAAACLSLEELDLREYLFSTSTHTLSWLNRLLRDCPNLKHIGLHSCLFCTKEATQIFLNMLQNNPPNNEIESLLIGDHTMFPINKASFVSNLISSKSNALSRLKYLHVCCRSFSISDINTLLLPMQLEHSKLESLHLEGVRFTNIMALTKTIPKLMSLRRMKLSLHPEIKKFVYDAMLREPLIFALKKNSCLQDFSVKICNSTGLVDQLIYDSLCKRNKAIEQRIMQCYLLHPKHESRLLANAVDFEYNKDCISKLLFGYWLIG